MMTTLHGLVTISELFTGFNLINTAVLNCLIMCQNARKMHHSEAKNPNIFWGGGQPPPHTLHPLGTGWIPPPEIPPLSAPRRLDNSRLRSTLPPNENPGSARD